jgi:hypothetical protein
MNNRFIVRLSAITVLSGLLCGGALAAAPTWICSITGTTACQDDGTTGQPDLGGLARPTFLRVDLDAKLVTILAPAERRGEFSKIETAAQVDGGWLLTGFERGRGWTMLVSDDGNMSLSMTGDGEIWSVFGNAIRAEDVKAPGKPAEKKK